MKPNVFELHFDVEPGGKLKGFEIDKEIKKLNAQGWVVKQISSCSSNKHWDSQEKPQCFVHLFLFAEKE